MAWSDAARAAAAEARKRTTARLRPMQTAMNWGLGGGYRDRPRFAAALKRARREIGSANGGSVWMRNQSIRARARIALRKDTNK